MKQQWDANYSMCLSKCCSSLKNDTDRYMKHNGFESEAYWEKNYTKNLCLAGNTIPDCAAPGPAELDSVAASNFAAYDCSSRDPVSSRVGWAATERSLLQDVQLLNHKGGRAPRRREKSIECTETTLSVQPNCSLCS